MDHPEEHRLIGTARQGDWEATARLLVIHSRRLQNRIARRIELNPFVQFQVEDVLQETFLDVFRGIATFEPAGEHTFAAWLNQICDRRLAQMLRQQNTQKRGGQARHVSSTPDPLRSSMCQLAVLLSDQRFDKPSAALAREEAMQAILAGLNHLPVDQRDALRLHYLEGKSLSTTAEAMSRTDGAIRGLLHRAKQTLRRSLGNSSRWFFRE
jgi:RNA polymerase sigma-70 factor (ECF subfamily)